VKERDADSRLGYPRKRSSPRRNDARRLIHEPNETKEDVRQVGQGSAGAPVGGRCQQLELPHRCESPDDAAGYTRQSPPCRRRRCLINVFGRARCHVDRIASVARF